MAYTVEQRDALQEAIASGVMETTYDGKRVKYQSMAEMRSTLAMMNAELAGASGTRPTSGYNPVYSKGT
jgi:hypothetical protein